MNRDVAKGMMDDNTSKASKRIIVDLIYDSFESRVCENCKLREHDGDDEYYCTHIIGGTTIAGTRDGIYIDAPDGFGCNNFIPKG